MTVPPLPGGTLFSRVRVYADAAPDGQRGGTPHIHLACAEMYYVLRGRGAVEFMTMQGLSRHEIERDSALCFSPGTIHRLINPDGDLEVLVLMQNQGLPERGDAAVTFAEDVMTSEAEYVRAMQADSAVAAACRRDRGVEGFMQLKEAFEHSSARGQAKLCRFYELAVQHTAPRFPEWVRIVRDGPQALAAQSLADLAALGDGSTAALEAGAVYPVHIGTHTLPGFCGHISPAFCDSKTYTTEGVRI